jgi:hypothetical protein
LRQTHDLWHETQAAYPDADAFVLKLNACIQTARSVTFVLQTEGRRRSRADFDAWYAPWQERMRADARMRWLIDARNAIEKEGDLDTHSIARVSLALTDQEEQLTEVEVPAAVSPADAATAIKLDELPERVRSGEGSPAGGDSR